MNRKIVLEIELWEGTDDVVGLWERLKAAIPELPYENVTVWLEEVDRRKIYVAHMEYEGGHAAYSTLEKAREGDPYCDYIEEWVIDDKTDPPVVWSRDRTEER